MRMISKIKAADYLDLKYSGSRDDVNITDADSELEAHLGILDLPESVFSSLV